jgi:hypothetical protein
MAPTELELPTKAGITTGPMRCAHPAGYRSSSLLLLLALLTCCALSQAYRTCATAVGIDFYQFWAVGRVVARHESSDIYSEQGRVHLGSEFVAEASRTSSPVQRAAAAHRRVFDTTSTPFLYAVVGKLTTDDYATNLRWYRVLLIGCFALSVVGISRLLGHSTAVMLASLALLSMWFEPLASDLRVGNVSCIQLAGIAGYAGLQLRLGWRFKDVAAGFWLGLLVAFKPNLALVAVLLLLGSIFARRWRASLEQAAAIAIGVGAAVGFSALAFGSLKVWFDWLDALQRVPDSAITVDVGNFAPSVLLHDQCGRSTWVVVGLAAVGAVALGSYFRRRTAVFPAASVLSGEAYHVIWLIALGCLGLVLVPHLAWLHYFVLTVPALLVVLLQLANGPTFARTAWPWLFAILGWLGLSINPFNCLGLSFTMRAFGTLTILATYLLLCALCGTPSAPEPGTG